MALTPRTSWAGWRESHASSSPTGAMALSGTKWKASGETTCDPTSLAPRSPAAGALCARGPAVRRALARKVVTSGWGLLELRPMRMSLEEIFLSLTTEEIQTPAGGERGTAHHPRE